jgi:hypothetical protein
MCNSELLISLYQATCDVSQILAHLCKGMIDRQKFLFEHIELGAGEPASVQRVCESDPMARASRCLPGFGSCGMLT